jgi:PTS system mannose-specific IID component
MNSGHNKIGAADLFGVFARSFLIQASWSFEQMQSLGFAYAIEPVLRKLYPDQAEYESRLKLHLDYFNTQPYLASFILGAVVRMERDRAAGIKQGTDVQDLKASLMAPLGALGDSFFWGSLKPFAVVIAVALVMAGSWWAPLLFLAIYNIGHIVLRAGALVRGFRSGGDVVDLMASYRFTSRARRFKVISLTVLGGIIGAMPLWRPEFRPVFAVPGMLMAVSGLALALVLVAILRSGSSPVKLMLGLAAGCLALAYAGVI